MSKLKVETKRVPIPGTIYKEVFACSECGQEFPYYNDCWKHLAEHLQPVPEQDGFYHFGDEQNAKRYVGLQGPYALLEWAGPGWHDWIEVDDPADPGERVSQLTHVDEIVRMKRSEIGNLEREIQRIEALPGVERKP